MAATNVQAFSGDVEISSNLAVSGSKFTYDNTNTTVFTGTANETANEIGYLDMSTSSTTNNIHVKVYIKYGQSAALGDAEYSFYIRPSAANLSLIYDYRDQNGTITPVVYRTNASDLHSGGTPGVVRFGYSIAAVQNVIWRVEVIQRLNDATFYPTNTDSAVVTTGLVQVTPAPFTRFDSNVNVGNGDLFVDTVGNKVGIGTTNPDNTLHIRNAIPAVLLDDSDDDTKVRFTGGAGGDLYIDSNWGGSGNTGDIIFREASSEKMRIAGNGNVGIGTNASPSQLTIASTIDALDATDSATFDKYTAVITNTMTSGADNKEIGLSFASYTGSTFATNARTPGAAITHERVDEFSKGKLHFKTKGNTNYNGACTTRMTIDESGNVGIGKTDPGTILDVAGDITASSIFIDDFIYHTTDTHTYFGFNAGDHFQIVEAGGVRFQVDSNGRVGIGVEAPAQLLDVAGRIRGDTMEIDTYIYHVGNTTTYMGFNANNQIVMRTNGTDRVTVKSDGDVGIGTDSPATQLEIRGQTTSSIPTIRLTNTAPGNAVQDLGGLEVYSVDGGGDFCGSIIVRRDNDGAAPDGNIVFRTGQNGVSSDRMIIKENGRVGIGTNNPDSELEIYGNTSSIKLTRSAASLNFGSSIDFVLFNNANEKFSYGRVSGSIADNTNGSEDGFMSFQVGTGGALGSNYEQEKMRIFSNGNVGIGTKNALGRLHISGGTGDAHLIIEADTNNSGEANNPRVVFRQDGGYLTGEVGLGDNHLVLRSRSSTSTNSGIKFYASNGVSSKTDLNEMETTQNEYMEIKGTGGAKIYGTENTTDYNDTNYAYTKTGLDANPNSQSFGLYVEQSVRAQGFVAISDKRIKSNIVDINDTYALDQIRAIKPKYYEYIDKKSRGSSSVIGFIAQEIKEVIPRAVAVTDGRIPNIYSFANITASNVLTFTDFNTSTLDSNATTSLVAYVRGNTNIKLTISEIIDEHSIRIVENIPNLGCSFDENGNVITETSTTTLTVEEYNNLESKDGYLPTISGYEQANVIISVDEYNSLEDKTGYTEVIDNYTITTTNYPGNEIFVWGQNVTDFHHINKDYIWTVATAALQEVDRQLQAEKARNDALEARITALENA
jgi:hypothetical protein